MTEERDFQLPARKMGQEPKKKDVLGEGPCNSLLLNRAETLGTQANSKSASPVNYNSLFFIAFHYFYVQDFSGTVSHSGAFIVLLGALFAILASAESLCNFCSQLIFNPLYTWTINELEGKFVAGITFFINAGILLIPMVLIG